VRWFALGQQMTVRNALDKLRAAFFFDIVEEDASLNLIKRGDRAVIDDTGRRLARARRWRRPGDPLRTIRRREQELPRTITMTYIDVDIDYNTGAQSSPRRVTLSEYDATLEMPIGLTAGEAAQKCWAIQCAEWTERESFEWQVPRWWAKITPTTLVKVRGRIIRVRQVVENRDTGVLTMEGVLAAPSVYTQVTTGSPGKGAGTGSRRRRQRERRSAVVAAAAAWRLPAAAGGTTSPYTLSLEMLLDLPILSQTDAPFGFYWVVCPANFHVVYDPAGNVLWPGATLYKSLDGGVTWGACASTTTKGTIGWSFSHRALHRATSRLRRLEHGHGRGFHRRLPRRSRPTS
jgi:hypothetical protein